MEAAKKGIFWWPASSLVAPFFGGIFWNFFRASKKVIFSYWPGHKKNNFLAASLIPKKTFLTCRSFGGLVGEGAEFMGMGLWDLSGIIFYGAVHLHNVISKQQEINIELLNPLHQLKVRHGILYKMVNLEIGVDLSKAFDYIERSQQSDFLLLYVTPGHFVLGYHLILVPWFII